MEDISMNKKTTNIQNNQTRSTKKQVSEKEKLSTKIEELEAKVAEYEKALTETNEKFLRLAAEFDNYRKRREKEITDIVKYAGEEILRDILPILDDLERAFNNTNGDQSLREGLELIYRKFQKTLQNLGVEPIESVNKPFDPNLHHAIMAREEAGVAPDIVLEEFEKGYKFKDRVLRYAKVVVSK